MIVTFLLTHFSNKKARNRTSRSSSDACQSWWRALPSWSEFNSTSPVLRETLSGIQPQDTLQKICQKANRTILVNKEWNMHLWAANHLAMLGFSAQKILTGLRLDGQGSWTIVMTKHHNTDVRGCMHVLILPVPQTQKKHNMTCYGYFFLPNFFIQLHGPVYCI